MEFNLCGVNPDRHNDLCPWGIKGFQEKEDEYKSIKSPSSPHEQQWLNVALSFTGNSQLQLKEMF